MARFTLPRDVFHGKGALEELKNFEGKKIFVSLIVAIVSFGLLAPLFRHFGGEPYGLCFTKNMNILIFLLNGAITVYYLLNDRDIIELIEKKV